MEHDRETSKSVNLLGGRDPLHSLWRGIDHLFEQVTSRSLTPPDSEAGPLSALPAGGMVAPRVNIAESETAFEITAELPGIDKKDVRITLDHGLLTLSGEKRDSREDKTRDYYLSERSYGMFRRRFRIPEGIVEDKIKAEYDKGVLTVTLPKQKPGKGTDKGRSIPIS